ncbi:lipid-A-disaccharide synthase [Xylophilus sp.]|uniref:lipid-A-disaccharide synthase n=1 Tax=Xylophilus sp. TaxID=2653893 RepID=UPI0013B89956|nr:lipid-A-disaccharide synthase [Xylophilus sp.]KAF1043408.1 MAG: Lipid-A-disaccharide synthase [Xylophilus sp.]
MDQAVAGGTPPRFALVAGEASGDLLAGLLLDGVRERWPGAAAAGIGGPQMRARGFDSWWPHERLAVFGYAEALRHYAGIAAIRRQLRDRLLGAADRPDLFIGVDAPDFNFGLEKALRAGGIRTVHFVCPSIWAWRPGRVEKIRAAADHVLCIFPFEPALLARHGIAATYVGHPLAAVIPLEPDRAAARRALGLQEEGEIVALLPGSRRSEVNYLADRFFQAAARIRAARPGVQFVVPTSAALRPRVEAAARAAGLGAELRIHEGRSHQVLAACNTTLIASGTATLEAALFKRPMVIAYNMHWLSWQLMRGRQLQPWVGLPNILCGDFVVPELLQDAATPAALADAVLRQLCAPPSETAALTQRFTALHHALRRDTPRLAADAIEEVLRRPAA